MKKYRSIALITLVALLLVFLRLTTYEPLGESISTYDTPGFIESGRIAFPSADFFLSNRPATISLMYKLFEPVSGYQLTVFSSPAEDIFDPPALQPGLDRVAVAQGLLSIAAWLLLAGVVARLLRHPGLQVLAVLLILAFGFSPTIAEWDAVLLSEPLSLTLFVYLLALSIELISRLTRPAESNSRWTNALIGIWGAILVLWIFARDTNAYFLLVLIVALIFLLIMQWRNKLISLISIRAIVIAIASLTLLFFVHNITLQQSGRWVNPFFNNMLHNVFPFADHVTFFESKGMPITDQVLALRNSPGNEDAFFEIPALMAWTTDHGTGTYMQFLLAFPGWTFEKFLNGVKTSFSENRQPFFFPNEERTPPPIAYIGGLLHPISSSVIWVVLTELALFGFLAFRHKSTVHISYFFMFAIFFLGEMLMLFVSIHGDALGVVRHGMGSVMPLRLSVWLLLPLILDLYGLPIQSAKRNQKKGLAVPVVKSKMLHVL